MLIAMRRVSALTLSIAATVHASPSIGPSVELAAGVQDVPGNAIVLVHVRAALCVWCDAQVALYGRIGGGVGGSLEAGANAADTAVGLDLQLCDSDLCFGARVSGGLQYVAYAPRPADGFSPESTGLGSLFFEARGHVAVGPVSFGLEARMHHHPSHAGPNRASGGVSVAYHFE